MIVHLADGTISLEGPCPVDDSATLHEYLVESPQATVDWSKCETMHTAVFQVLLAFRPSMRGTPAGNFVRLHLSPLLADTEP
jgi:hypothetical protein